MPWIKMTYEERLEEARKGLPKFPHRYVVTTTTGHSYGPWMRRIDDQCIVMCVGSFGSGGGRPQNIKRKLVAEIWDRGEAVG